MIGDEWTFWEYVGFGFVAFFASLIALVLDYWYVVAVLAAIFYTAWGESIRMKAILMAIALAALLSIAGCTSMLIGNALQQGRDLTPEQIEAIGKAGNSIYACINAGGPPPAGMVVWIVVPKDSKATVKFGDGCHVLPQ